MVIFFVVVLPFARGDDVSLIVQNRGGDGSLERGCRAGTCPR